MSNSEWMGITEVLDVIKKMRTDKTVEEFIAVMEHAESLDNLEYAWRTIKKMIDIARGEHNEELQNVIQDIMPAVEQIAHAYQDIGNAVSALDTANEKLKMSRNLVASFLPDSVVQIAADTTANVGDYILVKSVKRLLDIADQGINWCTVDVREPVTQETIKMCNRSKALIIGGGGLFLRDTNENNISGWQWGCSRELLEQIQVPIYVIGVGYNRFRGQEEFAPCFTENVNTLVAKSQFIGLRNHGSIRAIKNYLHKDLWDKVVYQPCATTVLSKLYEIPQNQEKTPFIALNCAFDRAQLRYGDRQDEIMEAIARVVKQLSEDYLIRCYLHCDTDEVICEYLRREHVPFEQVYLNRAMSEKEYLGYFSSPKLVLAMRGHAQMIPFGCVTPVVSIISHDKLKWFLEDIGHEEWGVDVRDAQFEEKLLDCCMGMLKNRTQICGQIEETQEKLWEITCENMQMIQRTLDAQE